MCFFAGVTVQSSKINELRNSGIIDKLFWSIAIPQNKWIIFCRESLKMFPFIIMIITEGTLVCLLTSGAACSV